jgi:hypothetical protein
VSIVAAVVAFILLVLIFELIRRKRLQERYALLWVAAGVVVLVLALWRGGLEWLSELIGIAYPPTTLFVLVSLFVVLLLLHYATVISRLVEQNKRLAQRLAILEDELGESEEIESDRERERGSQVPAG